MVTIRVIGTIFCVMGLLACAEREPQTTLTEPAAQTDNAKTATAAVTTKTAHAIKPTAYRSIEWTDLIPQEDLDALLNPPEYLQDIEDGSDADVLEDQMKAKPTTEADDRYQQALTSKTIKPEFNNQAIRIPGFIVPLEFNEAQTITTFFLVPFFGACLHMPPPPPNQIIYADYEPGITLEALYDPFWIEGTLSTTLIENDIATAAYSMTVDKIEPYLGED